MRQPLVALVCGILFALGLGISGMTQPGKVTAFLDFFGSWDPSLMFVMVGAILVYSVGYRLTVKRPKPLFSESFHIPTLRKVDRPLAAGAALFGIGWGLAGFCPGPALTSIVSLRFEPLAFVGFMILGMFLYELMSRKRRQS